MVFESHSKKNSLNFNYESQDEPFVLPQEEICTFHGHCKVEQESHPPLVQLNPDQCTYEQQRLPKPTHTHTQHTHQGGCEQTAEVHSGSRTWMGEEQRDLYLWPAIRKKSEKSHSLMLECLVRCIICDRKAVNFRSVSLLLLLQPRDRASSSDLGKAGCVQIRWGQGELNPTWSL